MEREKRNLGPHVATIKFNIVIQKVLTDGSIHPEIIDCKSLFKNNEIAQKGELVVYGYDIWNCVENVKQKLENLNG